MSTRSYVALVLHGHLPAVELREGSTDDALGERWLLEAIWECYLPLLELCDRLAADGIAYALTLSLSPTLASMLRAPALDGRMRQHLDALVELDDRLTRNGRVPTVTAEGRHHYAERLERARRQWLAMGGDLLGAFGRHVAEGRVELLTTAASHAYLPALTSSLGAVGAQLEVGMRGFESMTGARPSGLWLPECAFVSSLGADLARSRVRFTVVDGHGLSGARPSPPDNGWRPIVDSNGVSYFGRDRVASHQVWSRRRGYPGDPCYREFHRDVGYEIADSELGPLGTRLPTGLKYWRITGGAGPKMPYEPALAAERTAEHARHFVERLAERLGEASTRTSHPISVAAYDAELFGHWWYEWPAFLEQVLRRLAIHADLEATTLGRYLARHPADFAAMPAASSWGEGGHGQVWVGPRTAFLWRHVHATHRLVRDTLARCPDPTGIRRLALDQAVRESLLLQASDWAFMLHGGELGSYALAQVKRHHAAAHRLSAVAMGRAVSPSEAEHVRERAARQTFLRSLDIEPLLDAFSG